MAAALIPCCLAPQALPPPAAATRGIETWRRIVTFMRFPEK